MELTIKRGDIYYAELNPVIGSEQGGTRPVLIISNDIGNKHSPTVIIAPITSRIHTKAKLPTHNLDMSTYEYVEGDFPAIVSQEIWDKAQAIRESRMKPALVSAEKTTHSKRDSRDIWVNKLRCSCGSSYRKNKWHTKLDGKTSYGYQCYNQLNNGIRRKRAEIGLDTEGYCDSRMITDWKLDFMAKALLEHLWQERKESVLIALDLIRHYYKEERTLDNKSDAASIQARIDKANSRLANLIAMRADGEISKDEYQSMRSPIDKEIKELQKALEDTPTNKCCPRGLDLEGIRSTLNSLIDFSGSTISHDVINQFVYMVTPTSDTTFDWYVNLNGTADVKATFTAEGRKKSCIIKLEERFPRYIGKKMRTMHISLKTPLFLPFCTGCYQRGTLIEPTCFLGTFEIPKDFMRKSGKLYYGEHRAFRFPEKLEFKLFLV